MSFNDHSQSFLKMVPFCYRNEWPEKAMILFEEDGNMWATTKKVYVRDMYWNVI